MHVIYACADFGLGREEVITIGFAASREEEATFHPAWEDAPMSTVKAGELRDDTSSTISGGWPELGESIKRCASQLAAEGAIAVDIYYRSQPAEYLPEPWEHPTRSELESGKLGARLIEEGV